MKTIYGKIKNETEKAILFVAADSIHGTEQPLVGKNWWPKSQIIVGERSLGPLDSIDAPQWLIDSKEEESRKKRDEEFEASKKAAAEAKKRWEEIEKENIERQRIAAEKAEAGAKVAAKAKEEQDRTDAVLVEKIELTNEDKNAVLAVLDQPRKIRKETVYPIAVKISEKMNQPVAYRHITAAAQAA